MLIGTNYNFNGNQLLNAVMHQATAAPSTPVEGMMYTNTTAHSLNVYLNGSWVALSTSASSIGGGGTANQAAYWSALNVASGITVTSGLLAHDNTGLPAAVTSTTPGAILVASATRPVFSNCTILPNTTGFGITGGSTTAKTLTVSNTLTLAGTDSSTLNIGAGGTLGTAAFTAATAYEPALGNPGTNGYVLSSTTGGVRSWVANGFQNPMTTLGDLLYGGASGVATRLAGSAINGTYVLTEIVVASAAVAPTWTNINTLTVAKATNLVGAAWGVPYQSAVDTTSFVAQPGAANRVFVSGANNAAPAWTGGTLTLPASGSLAIPAFAVSFANAFAVTGAFSTSLTATGNTTLTLPAVSGTLATLAGTEALTNKTINGLTVTSTTGTLTIANGATLSIAGTLATTGAFFTSFSQSANLTLALPAVASATMIYNITNPAANNQLVYAATSGSGNVSYITAPAALSVLTQSSNAAAPAWTTATGTGSPVMGTDPTINISASNKLILNFTPSLGTDAVNKTYVDNIALGLNDWKQSVHVATTANVTLAGGAPNTLDGVTLVLNDRILVKNQSAPAENGIYYVSTLGTGANGTWTRATDADTSAEVTTGMYVYVEEGTLGKGQWVLNTLAPITLGTTALTFVKFNGGATLIAGNGIDIAGDTLSVKVNGSTTYTQYALLYHDTTTSINRVALPGTANLALAGATAGAPYWSTLVITPTGGSNATLSIAAGKTLTVSNSLTFAGADGKTINFGSNSFTLVTAKDAVTYTISGTSGSSVTQTIPTKFTTTITGAGPHTVTHNIGTKDVSVFVYDNTDNLIMCDVVTTSTTVVTLTWGFGAPGASTYRVVVIG